MLSIESLGAVGEVTGSCHLIRVGERRILLECGMYQGNVKSELRNRDPFAFDPSKLDAVIVSHAHIDHTGRIPLLIKRGYRGPVYAHKATRDLCDIMLKDAAFLGEKETEWENRKRERKGLERLEPLYSVDDASVAMKQFTSLAYDRIKEILPGVRVRLRDAGHILGSAIVELWLRHEGQEKKVVFSGDLGHVDAPILRDPTPVDEADVVLMESTYGDRLHRAWDATREELITAIAEAKAARGNILIPAFAVGRTQLVLYWLAEHFDDAGLNDWHIFLDSPMAIRATRAYTRYTALYDRQARMLWERHQRTSLLPNLHMSQTTNQSMALNSVRAGAIIIAGSGMCTGGRIKHHLLNNVWRKECHILIVGYQAYGTIGRALVDGAAHIRLWGETVRVGAKVHTIGGLSAHADQEGLMGWYSRFADRPPVLLVHGEDRARDALRRRLLTELNAPAYTMKAKDVIDLNQPLAAQRHS